MSTIVESEERERIKLDKIRDGTADITNITTDTGEIKIIMREYYMRLCDNKMKTSRKWMAS